MGQGWVMLVQLLVVPLYIKLLGIEAYGLMGFFYSVQVTVQVLDLGLGATLTREIARRRAGAGGMADARSLVKTVFIGYVAIAALIGAVIVAAAPVLATHLIHAEKLDVLTIRHAVMLMGLIIPVIWGANLLNATLMGMERQVVVNVLRIVAVTINAAGAVLVLWLVSPTVTAFFTWQLATGLASCFAAGWIAHGALPGGPARFKPALLKELWRYAAGMSAISVGGIILMQLDKWLLINLLPLATYGYYVLATSVANALYAVITPLFSSVFPRVSLLHARGDEAGLSRLYHSSAQYIAALVLPLAMIVSLFSEPLLLLWIRNPEVAHGVAPIASVLVWGTALNGLMNIPYALQLASGYTWLAFRLVMVKLVLFVPTIVFLTLHFGALGAAAAWLSLNLLYVLIGIPLTHAHLLKGEARTWLLRDVLPAAAAAVAAGALAYGLRPRTESALELFAFLVVATLASLAAAGLAVKEPRAWIGSHARSIGLLRGGP